AAPGPVRNAGIGEHRHGRLHAYLGTDRAGAEAPQEKGLAAKVRHPAPVGKRASACPAPRPVRYSGAVMRLEFPKSAVVRAAVLVIVAMLMLSAAPAARAADEKSLDQLAGPPSSRFT